LRLVVLLLELFRSAASLCAPIGVPQLDAGSTEREDDGREREGGDRETEDDPGQAHGFRSSDRVGSRTTPTLSPT
jgi:hypothetical protein